MRCISKATNLKRTVIHAERTIVNGKSGPEYVVTREPYIALFTQGGATAYEKQLALEKFKFTGTGEREDPLRRISIFDTDEKAAQENWTPEFKDEVEKSLLAGQGEFYFVVEAPKVEKPWPAYDTASPEDIPELAEMFGVSSIHVLAYERENQNRPSVIEALEVSDPDEVEISA